MQHIYASISCPQLTSVFYNFSKEKEFKNLPSVTCCGGRPHDHRRAHWHSAFAARQLTDSGSAAAATPTTEADQWGDAERRQPVTARMHETNYNRECSTHSESTSVTTACFVWEEEAKRFKEVWRLVHRQIWNSWNFSFVFNLFGGVLPSCLLRHSVTIVNSFTSQKSLVRKRDYVLQSK